MILDAIINEYIKRAEPISSQLLEEEYNFGIRGAMIRREMQELCDLGYLTQPYTSAGRVPTKKGYRSYVDKLLEEAVEKNWEQQKFDIQLEEEDVLRMFHLLTKRVALLVSNFALGYMRDTALVWKEGWEQILREPELQSSKSLLEFVTMIGDFEQNLGHMKLPEGIKVYIGEENPFAKTGDFSAVLTHCQLPDKQDGIIAVIGPIRMHYEHTVRTLRELTRFLQEKFA